MAWQTNTGGTALIRTPGAFRSRPAAAILVAVEKPPWNTRITPPRARLFRTKRAPIPPSVISAAVIRRTALALNWRLVR